MPTGVILASGNSKTTKEDLDKVLEANGYEVEKEEVAEPKREDFETDEAFDAAHAEFEAAQKPKDEPKAAKADEPKPKPTRQQRIRDRATEELRRDLDEANRKIAELQGKKEPEPAKEEPRPKRVDFKSQEDYEDALMVWGHKRATTQEARQTAEQRQQEYVNSVEQGYVDRVQEWKDEHEDWEDLIKQNSDIPMYPEVQWFIKEQENGPAIMDHLLRHPEELKNLTKLSPLAAVGRVGSLSEKLKSAPEAKAHDADGDGKETKPKPRVPAPVRPVSTGGAASSATSRDVAGRKPYAGQYQDFKKAMRREAGR